MTDSTSTKLAPAEPMKPALRAEPTEEAKIAGQAALARLEAKKTDKPKFNTYVSPKIIYTYYIPILLYLVTHDIMIKDLLP